jgi:hypothetical protein
MNKKYCRNEKGICKQVFIRLIGLDKCIHVCGNFAGSNYPLHSLKVTKYGIERCKPCLSKFGHEQARNK